MLGKNISKQHFEIFFLIFPCLLVLRFYGPINQLGSCQAWSVYLTTLFLGQALSSKQLTSTCAFFHQKLTTALLDFLNQGKEENEPRKYFMIYLQERMLLDPARIKPVT